MPKLQLTTDPAADLQPAGADGSILVMSADEVFLAEIGSDGLAPIERIPADRAVLPACVAGDGRPVVADAETLELLVSGEVGLSPLTDVPFTTGDCAPLPDGHEGEVRALGAVEIVPFPSGLVAPVVAELPATESVDAADASGIGSATGGFADVFGLGFAAGSGWSRIDGSAGFAIGSGGVSSTGGSGGGASIAGAAGAAMRSSGQGFW